jgi:hypothetical protein
VPTSHTSNNTGKDIIPPLSLDYDCCLSGERSNKLNKIHLDLPIKRAVNHLDDLNLASYRVEEVEKLIRGRVKLKHSNTDYHLSFLSYVGMIITCLIFVIFCYCSCCRCFHRKCPNFFKWWQDNNPCRTIVLKPKIVNSIHTSRKGLQFPSSRPIIKHRRSQSDCQENTELAFLNCKS